MALLMAKIVLSLGWWIYDFSMLCLRTFIDNCAYWENGFFKDFRHCLNYSLGQFLIWSGINLYFVSIIYVHVHIITQLDFLHGIELYSCPRVLLGSQALRKGAPRVVSTHHPSSPSELSSPSCCCCSRDLSALAVAQAHLCEAPKAGGDPRRKGCSLGHCLQDTSCVLWAFSFSHFELF